MSVYGGLYGVYLRREMQGEKYDYEQSRRRGNLEKSGWH